MFVIKSESRSYFLVSKAMILVWLNPTFQDYSTVWRKREKILRLYIIYCDNYGNHLIYDINNLAYHVSLMQYFLIFEMFVQHRKHSNELQSVDVFLSTETWNNASYFYLRVLPNFILEFVHLQSRIKKRLK